MIDEARTALVTPPSRLVLLSNSELLDNSLHQHLHDNPQLRLIRSNALRPGVNDADLILIDVGSFTDDECLRLLRQLRDTATALVNAQPEQARRLLEPHPWIKGVF